VRVGQPPHTTAPRDWARHFPVRKHLEARLPPIEYSCLGRVTLTLHASSPSRRHPHARRAATTDCRARIRTPQRGSSALAKNDPPLLVRRGPDRDRRSVHWRGGDGAAGSCSAFSARDKGRRGAVRARADWSGRRLADDVASEGDWAVGTRVEDERDAVMVDGAAEPERLLHELEGDLGGGDPPSIPRRWLAMSRGPSKISTLRRVSRTSTVRPIICQGTE